MALANLNPDNALMFGSDDDSLYLAAYGSIPDLADLEFDDPIPAGMIDVGWVSDDGFSDSLKDSAEKIRGHQGNRVVKAFVKESDTSIGATLLETKLKTFEWFYNATGVKVGATAKFVLPTARKAVELCGISVLIDTSSGKKMIKIYEHLTLTERGSVAFKVGDITAYQITLDVIDDPILLTNVPGLIPA